METIVFFSLKAGVWRIMRPFFFVAAMLSITLLVLGFFVSPKATYVKKEVLYAKQDEAQINIRVSEFGQKFGDWLLFVGGEDKDGYKDLAMYSAASGQRSGYFVLAGNAQIQNDRGLLSLILRNGKSYETASDRIRQMDFETMRVNQAGRSNAITYDGLMEHWSQVGEKRSVTRDFVWAVLAALFAPLSVPAAALGIYSPRTTKNRVGAQALILCVLFYLPAMLIGERGGFGFFALIVAPLWLMMTLYLVKRKLRTF
jgi:lipopolysaccharide export system permease protein